MFGFKWFGSKEREELKKQIKELTQEVEILKHRDGENGKPYKTLKKIGKNVIVVLHDGTNLQTSDEEVFELSKHALTEDELVDLFSAKPIHMQEQRNLWI